MFDVFISISVLVICYLAYGIYNEYMGEDEAKRKALIASIEQLKKISQSSKP